MEPVSGILVSTPSRHRPETLTVVTIEAPPSWVLRKSVAAGTAWLPLMASLLVVLPVFLQAPWVRLQPFGAALFTLPLLFSGLALERNGRGAWKAAGPLLVGFSGSWLGGCLFWGWCREHPLWHLPIEAFALPLALGGLRSRWHLAGSFYLASLLGTACTDAVMALCGVMEHWPAVIAATPEQAPALLHQAALAVVRPPCLMLVAGVGAALVAICHWGWSRPGGGGWRMASATLATTLAVDGLFLAAALLAPRLSGLI